MRLAIVILTSVLCFIFEPVEAGGLFDEIFSSPMGPNIGQQLDDINRAAGNPIDHGVQDSSQELQQNITSLCAQNPQLDQCVEILGDPHRLRPPVPRK